MGCVVHSRDVSFQQCYTLIVPEAVDKYAGCTTGPVTYKQPSMSLLWDVDVDDATDCLHNVAACGMWMLLLTVYTMLLHVGCGCCLSTMRIQSSIVCYIILCALVYSD